MLFPTVDFGVFFLVVLTGSWLLRPYHKAWRWFVLAASCVFYLDPFNPVATDGESFVHLNLVILAVAAAFGWFVSVASRLAFRDGGEPSEHRRAGSVWLPVVAVAGFLVANFLLWKAFPDRPDQNSRWLFLLLGVAFVNQAFARSIFAAFGPGRARTPMSRWLVRLAIVFNLAILGFFKYAEFLGFQDPLQRMMEGLGVDFRFILPIAISFFTFQAISYVMDVGRGELHPIPLLDFAVYLTFFPQVVAGPIVRVTEFVPQFDQRADPRFVEAAEAFMLIFRGLFKKVVISSLLAAQIVDPVFDVPGSYSRIQVLLAIYGFAIQIYADFSGYTDIAIGCALLLGFRFPQNFDAPYIALSLQDFWRRWHMTLSRWLRDYLYIPLGGNRRGEGRTYVNLMLTMLLGGLWHGANWTFVVWGGIHGGGLALERYVRPRWKPIGLHPAVVKVLQWVLTFNVVCLAWVFFRAESFADAWAVLGQLLTGGESITVIAAPLGVLALVIVASIASQFVPERYTLNIFNAFTRLPPVVQALGIAAAITVIGVLGPEGVAPFIYFQF